MKRTPTGFTLIELMISIVLGIIIIFGIGQIFVATRTSFSAQQGLSQIQQSGRFAMDFMANAVRSAGDMGFNNSSSLMRGEETTSAVQGTTNPSRLYQITNAAAAGPDVAAAMDFAVPLQVYEWNGSAPGNTVTLTDTTGASPESWTPRLPLFVAERAVPGSDVIIARYVRGRTVQVSAVATTNATPVAGFTMETYCVSGNGLRFGVARMMDASSNLMEIDDYGPIIQAGSQRQLIAVGQHDMVLIAQANILAGGDLEARTYGGVGFPGNYTDDRRCGPYGQEPPNNMARLGLANVDIFYIGRNTTTRDTGFWRMSFNGADDLPFMIEELVENVENMQVLLGITLPVGTQNASNRPDRYVTAAQLNDPGGLSLPDTNATSAARRTMSAKVSLLVRSENNAAGELNNLTYSLAGTTINPIDDRRIRQVYDQTLAVRNRMRLLSGGADNY